jgi:hypothetical protein
VFDTDVRYRAFQTKRLASVNLIHYSRKDTANAFLKTFCVISSVETKPLFKVLTMFSTGSNAMRALAFVIVCAHEKTGEVADWDFAGALNRIGEQHEGIQKTRVCRRGPDRL